MILNPAPALLNMLGKNEHAPLEWTLRRLHTPWDTSALVIEERYETAI